MLYGAVTFVKQPGNVDLGTFPPGSGDAEPMGVDDSALTGTAAAVALVEMVAGSPRLTASDTFNLTLSGATTDPIAFYVRGCVLVHCCLLACEVIIFCCLFAGI